MNMTKLTGEELQAAIMLYKWKTENEPLIKMIKQSGMSVYWFKKSIKRLSGKGFLKQLNDEITDKKKLKI